MDAISLAIRAVERAPLPDALTSAGIEYLVSRTRRKLAHGDTREEQAFVHAMAHFSIALHADDANRQHYEMPAEFFGLTLGPRRKYSSCLYERGHESLREAEERALEETALHAGLHDGQRILELGCGWGSLTLFMAERYPKARIVAVSNSASQRQYIEAAADSRGLGNVTVITADMNVFESSATFDRIVSVEMFEHMTNWRRLLERVRKWLSPDGRLFLHVFSHRHSSYRFDHGGRADWIARHFFTGGIMPSHALVRHFPDVFAVEAEWRWSGTHYQRTALDWLANFDANRVEIDPILERVYGADAGLWRRRWRLFFLATAGLFGHRNGDVWGVSHYRLKPVGGR
jgi:cyclopropane-fatty-acyl-phospholipid synthase